MDTAKLKKFAQAARSSLLEQVEAKLKLVRQDDSAARREHPAAVKKLEETIRELGQEQVIERVAYIWFNRFCALRFMDVNRYTRIGVVSPAESQFQPEILAEAKMGHIDDEMVPEKTRQQIFDLLDGKAPSRDPQGEAYRLLVVAACNYWNKAMPFLFQRIDDYTELLMPDDLLSANSILTHTREAMTPDACEDVEVIGWLYQFYISEKKEEVDAKVKGGGKVQPEEISPKTALFTPHWIVRYLVENSLGRLWLLNRPDSKLIEQMDYYIRPEQAETDFLKINRPEEIKICDPACGSGHMLTYAFDLLYSIYEEEGVDPSEIPEKILTHNLYGIEIDERAGELAAFALTMKARARQRRFFNKGVKPNICVLENVHFDENELNEYIDFVGRDLFTAPLQTTLRQFEEANNFGSLIRPEVTDVGGMIQTLEMKDVSGQLFLSQTQRKVLQALRQADYLSPKYHVLIANPPYMGGGGMNRRLNTWVKKEYPDSKADLMTCFMERASQFVFLGGFWGMINLPSWMFLSSFEKLRKKILRQQTIASLIHPGRGIFGSDFGSVAFVIKNTNASGSSSATYRKLYEKFVQVRAPEEIESLFLDGSHGKYILSQNEFLRIPGAPIAYWVSKKFRRIFERPPLSNYFKTRLGLSTANNDRFLRGWQEVSINNIGFDFGSRDEAQESQLKWFPYEKGGAFRKWFGNHDFLVNWKNDGEEIRSFGKEEGRIRSHNYNLDYIFKGGITWSDVTSGTNAFRCMPKGFLFDGRGSSGFVHQHMLLNRIFGFLNSKISTYAISAINPTVAINVGEIAKLPFPELDCQAGVKIDEAVSALTSTHKVNWDSHESSWDFRCLPLLNPGYRQPNLRATYQKLRAHWQEMTLEMQRLEEENNRIFIEAYGLQGELTPEVPINEITLTCNPHYRYGGDKSEDELEALLLADTMRELVSYAVGCMFGRYALDKPGLILANQGETLADYLKQIPEPVFPADDDNVIPMLDGDWFTDDITERFRQFLRVAFGEEHYEENLLFVEQGLNIKGKRNYSIRDYFLGEFYNDHVRRYKKRPIYWLFSSPKGSFNALIYMHRYRPDTVSVVLNDYLREFRTKLSAHKSHLEAVSISSNASAGEKTKALKEIDKINKMIVELEDYEREVLYPLATEQVEIDLDDGVKANYPRFGAALKKIAGLEAKDD